MVVPLAPGLPVEEGAEGGRVAIKKWEGVGVEEAVGVGVMLPVGAPLAVALALAPRVVEAVLLAVKEGVGGGVTVLLVALRLAEGLSEGAVLGVASLLTLGVLSCGAVPWALNEVVMLEEGQAEAVELALALGSGVEE